MVDPFEVETRDEASGVFEAQPEPATVEAQPRPPSSEETGIVRTVKVDDWSIDFRLPSLTTEGAERARVSLTELARFLGYSDKAQLKRLAERHAQEISQFGGTVTVKVPCQAGARGWTMVEEPTYNQDQCIILGLASKTAVGSEIRVRMLKAYKALLATFEQVVREQPQTSVLERALTVMAQSQQALAANQNTTNMLLQSLISGRRQRTRLVVSTAQQVIPQTVEQTKSEPVDAQGAKQKDPETNVHFSEVRRIAEQDLATDRKVLSAMIRRLAGAVRTMPTLEYRARMSVAYKQIEDEFMKYGHDLRSDSRLAHQNGRDFNSLDWFEEKGVMKLAMRIVEELYSKNNPPKTTV